MLSYRQTGRKAQIMKITKDYPGLTQAKNGDYIMNGDLISEEGIEIDLDNCLVVTGSIKSRYGIKAGRSITARCEIQAGREIQAGWGIKAGQSIKARYGIQAGWGIKAGQGIKAGCSINAGDGIAAGCSIESGRGIKAGDGITAGWGIKAGTYIDCGKRIFAGISVYADDDYCEKTIQCAELRNGTVAYGDLICTPAVY